MPFEILPKKWLKYKIMKATSCSYSYYRGYDALKVETEGGAGSVYKEFLG